MSTYKTPMMDEIGEGLEAGSEFTQKGRWIANELCGHLRYLEQSSEAGDIHGELDAIGTILHHIANLLNELNENICTKTRKK